MWSFLFPNNPRVLQKMLRTQTAIQFCNYLLALIDEIENLKFCGFPENPKNTIQ